MNKQAMSAPRAQDAQSGFTLIELIVVIVILGILAATAIPRFTNIGNDARAASVNAARGSLASVAAMAHGQALVTPAATTVAMEGVTVTLVNGYPAADANTALAAGLNSTDYTILPAGTAATANNPAVAASSFLVQPNSAAGRPSGLTCWVSYTASTAVNTPPVITNNANAANCP